MDLAVERLKKPFCDDRVAVAANITYWCKKNPRDGRESLDDYRRHCFNAVAAVFQRAPCKSVAEIGYDRRAFLPLLLETMVPILIQ